MNSTVKINDYITLSSEQNKITVFIQEEKFQEFEYSFINGILNKCKNQLKKINNQCDYIVTKFGKDSFNRDFNNFVNILKFWIRKNYDTEILPYTISFPLLKKLVEIGDIKAKKVFINEILKNLWEGDPLVVKYLFSEKFYDFVALDNYRRQIHTPKINEIKLTLFICFINIFIYILFNEILHIADLFFFDKQKIFNNFEVWRLITAIFVHLERFSLFINTIFLYCVGSYFEANNVLSKSIYFIVYLLSGLFGNIVYMLILSQLSSNTISSGASGAIFGLAGAFIVILLVKKKYNWILLYIFIFTFLYIYTINPRINYISHLFGFIFGMVNYSFFMFFNRGRLAPDGYDVPSF
ncbi:MAG: rhomboid family intramembrane serine protease [Promethearchaeota archaeon]